MTEKNKDWKKFKEQHEQPQDNLAQEINDDEQPSDALAASLDLDYEDLQEKCALMQQELKGAKDQVLRAAAQVKNAERRATEEVRSSLLFGLSKFIDSLIPVVDSLEQALILAEKEQQTSMVEGLQLTLKLFLDALQKQGVVQLNPEGEIFNPQEHEAMSMQSSAAAAPNAVLMVFQKGYTLNGRVIRPARVIVNKSED